MAASSTKVVELGFAEPPEAPLTPNLFPSKIGGRPAWLNPEHVLSAEQVSCGVCDKCMILLIQLYTPEDQPPEAFHRTIYVFCCKNGACHKTSWKKSLKVFRSQMPNENSYWPPSTGSIGENDLADDQSDESSNGFLANFITAKLCIVCGLLGSKRCGKCSQTHYCSKEHQTVHWTIGKHKVHCINSTESPSSVEEHDNLCRKSILFPELEVISEPEKNLNKHEIGVDDDNSLQEGNSRALVPVGDEIYENTQVNVDKAFLKFQKKVEPYPDQVLRYVRLEYESEKNADPLWVSDIGKPTPEDIPPCVYCHQERTFEFQILSTLLNYLDIDNTKKDSLDWGSIFVYSCRNNCHVNNMYYIEEFLWRQDFSEEGVNLDRNM
ncbi:2444_t:CDS:2 [Acaulospora morrowiae]|uniref:2444_t:CDS:1 n=1 Tax=Acaulospora morrowiae TaxID=94023 RepID=A0A9N9AWU5_9GLOM|nr:2444_t:CDS:2 [Acaulospora morrowiae]